MGTYKTVCKRGHDLSEKNRGSSRCIQCQKVRDLAMAGTDVKLNRLREQNWKRYKIVNTDKTPFTLNDYNRLFQIQGGRCGICNKHQTELERALSADHNHETGEVRGLLCTPCNTALGSYESIKVRAEKYLNKF